MPINPFPPGATGRRGEETLEWRVTDAQRERVVGYLKEAYVDGRLGVSEMEDRVERALSARTRRELNATLSGLATVPLVSSAVRSVPREEPGPGAQMAVGMTGLSSFAAGPIGPIVGTIVAQKGSWAHRQLARQANFQILTFVVAMLVILILSGSAVFSTVMGIGTLGWFLFTLAHAVKGFQGEDWRNPVMKAVPLRVLDEGPRKPRELGRGRG